MLSTRQPTNRASPLILILSATAAIAGPQSASAAPEAKGPPAVLEVGVPAGFDEMARPQKTVVDVIYGGQRIGQAEVEFEPGKLTFANIDALLDLLPDLIDRDTVRQTLATGPLDTHAELVCNVPDRNTCMRLNPAVAGIVFDQDRFRVELHVNPRFLKVRAATEQAYLPQPDAALSLVNSIAGTVAGGSGSDTIFAVQNRAVLAAGDARIISTSSYGSSRGFIADVLAAQLDKPGMRYTGGVFWVPDIDLIGRRRIIGAGIETQFDTRLDKDLIKGSPLIVSLSQRSRVDLLVDGRLVSSRTYEAGNQSVDTVMLPEGAYEVILQIQEVGGASRSERRFFSKNSRIAPLGQTLWFVHGGVLANEGGNGFISATNDVYFQGGVAKRLSAHFALDATVIGTNGRAIAELGGYIILPFAQMRLAAMGSSRQDTGAIFQLNSSGTTAFNYNFDYRRVHSHDNRPLVPVGTFGRRPGDIGSEFDNAFFAASTFTQLIGDVSYHLPRARLALAGFYRRDKGRETNYAIGPTAQWSVFQRNGLDITIDANVSQSNRGRSAFAGLRLQLFRSRSSFTATVGAQSNASDGEGKRSRIVGGIGGSYQDEDVLGGDLTLTGNLDHTADSDLAHARADLRGPLGVVAADVVQRLSGGGTQYSLGMQTTAIAGPNMLAIRGKDQSDSMIAVQLTDVPPSATFEVLVNETPRGLVQGGETLPIAVTPYRQYSVRVRPHRGELLHFDSASRVVSVFPGNVAKLAWTAKRVVAMFGRALWPDGSPVAEADIITDGAIGHTDPNGYFQIEATPGATLKLRTANGNACRLTLGEVKEVNGYAALGAMTCRTELQPDTNGKPTEK